MCFAEPKRALADGIFMTPTLRQARAVARAEESSAHSARRSPCCRRWGSRPPPHEERAGIPGRRLGRGSVRLDRDVAGNRATPGGADGRRSGHGGGLPKDGRSCCARAQEHLRHSEAATQAAILDALPARVALLDQRGLIISVNEAWRRSGAPSVVHGPGHAVGVELPRGLRERLERDFVRGLPGLGRPAFGIGGRSQELLDRVREPFSRAGLVPHDGDTPGQRRPAWRRRHAHGHHRSEAGQGRLARIGAAFPRSARQRGPHVPHARSRGADHVLQRLPPPAHGLAARGSDRRRLVRPVRPLRAHGHEGRLRGPARGSALRLASRERDPHAVGGGAPDPVAQHHSEIGRRRRGRHGQHRRGHHGTKARPAKSCGYGRPAARLAGRRSRRDGGGEPGREDRPPERPGGEPVRLPRGRARGAAGDEHQSPKASRIGSRTDSVPRKTRAHSRC